jgi:hypothetical protein
LKSLFLFAELKFLGELFVCLHIEEKGLKSIHRTVWVLASTCLALGFVSAQAQSQELQDNWRLTQEEIDNPAHELWVYEGSRTGDEMSHTWNAVTHLDEEGFDKLVADRKVKEQRSLATNN